MTEVHYTVDVDGEEKSGSYTEEDVSDDRIAEEEDVARVYAQHFAVEKWGLGFDVTDVEIEVREEEDPTFNAEEETVTDAWEGVYLYTSWGYGQTNVEMAQITEVSGTGKTVKARMVRPEKVENDGHGSDRMRPSSEQYGDEFRLQVRSRHNDDEPMFRGSYPFVDGDKEKGTRLDNMYVFENTPGKTVHQTAHGYKH